MAKWWSTRPLDRRRRLWYGAAITLLGAGSGVVSHVWGVAPYVAFGPSAGWNDTLAIVDATEGPRVREVTPVMAESALAAFQVQTRVTKLEWLGCTVRSEWGWQLVPLGQAETWPPEGTGVMQGLSDRRGEIADAMINRGGESVDLRAMVRSNQSRAVVWHFRGVAGFGARVLAVVLAPAGLVMLFCGVSRAEIGRARVRAGFCPRCVYPLGGLVADVQACPECGEGFARYRMTGGRRRGESLW